MQGVLSVVLEPICTLAAKTVGAEALCCFTRAPRQGADGVAKARPTGLLEQLEIAAARAGSAVLASLPEPLYLTIGASLGAGG
jgi:hypothetical protein